MHEGAAGFQVPPHHPELHDPGWRLHLGWCEPCIKTYLKQEKKNRQEGISGKQINRKKQKDAKG
jgi:hypothetical protein